MDKILALQMLSVEDYAAELANSNTSCGSCVSNQCCSFFSWGCESTRPPQTQVN